MEARMVRLTLLVTALTAFVTSQSFAASYRTENFVITAPTPRLAQQIGNAAEQYRKDLAVEWLGAEMRPWSRPCPITAEVSPELGAGGATSFVFHHGEVYGWEMVIQGSEERILDSVLPHEVTHTVFATHFRQPLPRWADEGACTTVEHHSEKLRHQKLLIDFLKTGRGIPMDKMFAMTEYPRNKADVLPLYSQAFSVARYMIQHGGKRKFIAFVEAGLASGDWKTATQSHYGYNDLAVLQNTWLDWVRNGSPQLVPAGTPAPTAIAAVAPRDPARPTTFAPLPSDAPAATAPAAVTPTNPPVTPDAVAAASFEQPASAPARAMASAPAAAPSPAAAPNSYAAAPGTQRLPVNWQPVPTRLPPGQAAPPDATADTAATTATTAGPPRRYQAVRQQPPQRPQQRVLRKQALR